MKALAAALLVMGMVVPAAAQQGDAGERASAQAAPATAATAQPKKEKKICKRQESSVSRLGGGPRICKTAAEWRDAPVQDDSEKLLMNEGNNR